MFDCVLSLAVRLSSAAVITGWVLSALGELNGWGYLVLGVPLTVGILVFTVRQEKPRATGKTVRRLRRWWKQRRALPLIYFGILALIIAGSILHEPNNFDGLSYREPKVLFWLDRQQWHWIASPYEVVNYTLPNYEWLTVPFFLATRGFHATVIINWVAMIFLPSLMFTLLRFFGARAKAAFDWMWMFPTSYVIAMQAGGIGNDVTGLAALLGALHFAGRFARQGRSAQLFDALLAAGFCTGIKLSNLPLPGFVLILLAGNRAAIVKKRAALGGGFRLGLVVSAVIPIINNIRHTGTVFGTATNADQIDNPVAGWIGNALMMLAMALEPPFLPGAGSIMPAVERCLGARLVAWLQLHYGKFSLRMNELPQEEIAGLGLGISVALLINGCLWWRARRNHPPRRPRLTRWQWRAWWGWFIFAMLVVAARLGTGLPFARNVLPWYPVVLAPMIARFSIAPLGRSRLWRWCAPLAALSVLPAIVLNPSRPLLPAEAALKLGQALHFSTALVERMRTTYEVYEKRPDAFGVFREDFPPNMRVLGIVSDGSEPSASYWKPYFTHRCVYLTTDAEMRAARAEGIEYFLVSENISVKNFNLHTDALLARYGARPVKSADIRMLAGRPAIRYTLAKFEPK